MVLININLPIKKKKKGVSTDSDKTNYERMGG